MNAAQQRNVLVGAMLAGLPSRADFRSKFTADKAIITSNVGDAIVHLAKTPVRGADNQLVSSSNWIKGKASPKSGQSNTPSGTAAGPPWWIPSSSSATEATAA